MVRALRCCLYLKSSDTLQERILEDMEKFTLLRGIVAYLPMLNVDTDMIIPKHFLKTIKRSGLREGLFYDLRYTSDNSEDRSFILNREEYRETRILVTGENFGCGSSREHAVWALLDFGIRCIIAPSFGDIFYQNCLKNAILPVVLSGMVVESLGREADSGVGVLFTVDLERQLIYRSGGDTVSFTIEEFSKYCLLNGLDDIALTLRHVGEIERFEEEQRMVYPWLWLREGRV